MAGLPEAGNRAVHNIWIDRLDGLIVESIPLQVTHLVVFNQDVALPREIENQLLALRNRQIDRNTLLVTVGTQVHG
jgi:hypothetical protein